ncbi:hypothetical protein SEA_KEITHERIE_3 [Mycobacterium phage Keitherie]|uniref:Gp3 n=1 Tax=Mycobacterium phage Keitherie TaxID=2488971 RepID=A0A3G8FPI7_9CAUD|nr:hypothetical protein SEA_KEITHERIE_3 [Mycobacterium phage Keitherie]
MIETTATSVTEFDGTFESVITWRFDGLWDVAVAHMGTWLCHAQIAASFEDARFLAGYICGQHMRAEWMVAA